MKFSYQGLLCVLLLTPVLAQANRFPPSQKPTTQNISFTRTTSTHFIQFFSSGNATKAEGMKNTLELEGYPAFVFVNLSKPAGQPYYQVQVGPFATRDLAMRTKKQVVNKYPQYHFLNDAILKTSL